MLPGRVVTVSRKRHSCIARTTIRLSIASPKTRPSTRKVMTDGPSKNELKKAAKKAEKAAKKAAHAAAEGGKQPASGGQPKKSDAKQDTTPAPTPKLHLINAAVDNVATLKVMWAAIRVGVEIFPPVSKAQTRQVLASSYYGSEGPLLCYGSSTVGDPTGNALALAVSHMNADTKILPHVQLQIQEWCDWERNVLAATAHDAKKSAAALQHLESKLSGLHLVGDTETVADLVILSTLSSTTAVAALKQYPAVQRFVEAHSSSLLAAKKATEGFVAASSSGTSINMEELSKEPCLLHVVDTVFRATIADLYGEDVVLPNSCVKECQNVKFGDYQCSAAMPVFAELKKSGGATSPQQVAQAIIDGLGSNHPVLMELSTTGPGFVIARLRPAFLQQHVSSWLLKSNDAVPRIPCSPRTLAKNGNTTCLVDFSSPNIAKEMHVGHLRSTIIGESVCRILESVGCKVHRVNHVGDWGTQFGMLIQYLKEEYPDVASGKDEDLPNITDLTGFYKAAKQRFDDSADFKKLAQTNVVKLQSGDEECRKIWQMLCDVSRREFDKVYKRLDVSLEEFGESYYNAMIPPVIDEFEKAGILTVEEGGAKCVFFEDRKRFKIPLMLQKSDGGFGYDSTDMAALRHRLFTLNSDRVIVITDFSQADHFAMLYQAARDINWVTEQRLEHIGFGTVMGEDGKRFKTRSGETVRLVDLLDEAVNRMEATLRERIADKKANITESEVHEVAEAIGYGAVKYFDLRRNPTSNYKFSYDQMLSTSGDTAVYLLYARVRLESICAKAKAEHGVDVEELAKSGEPIVLEHTSERNVAWHLQKYADCMEQTLDDLFPYHLCEYVYRLSIATSDFVTQCKVLGDPAMNSRLLLCYATTLAMKQCFDLLGIRNVKRI